jgi:hypothetical protein
LALTSGACAASAEGLRPGYAMLPFSTSTGASGPRPRSS